MRITELEYEEAQKIIRDYERQIREEKKESELRRLFSTKEGKLAKELGLTPYLRGLAVKFTGQWFTKDEAFFLEYVESIGKFKIFACTNDGGRLDYLVLSQLEFDNFEEAALKMIEL